MSDLLTSIRLPGSSGIAEWGVLAKDEMVKKVRDYFKAQKDVAEKYLDACDTDFEISVIKGSCVQRHVKWIQKPPTPDTSTPAAPEVSTMTSLIPEVTGNNIEVYFDSERNKFVAEMHFSVLESGDTAGEAIQKLRDKLDDEKLRNRWQPMETAPRDGTEFLAVASGLDGKQYVVLVSWKEDPNTAQECFSGIDGDDWAVGSYYTPYHDLERWRPMPLPEDS